MKSHLTSRLLLALALLLVPAVSRAQVLKISVDDTIQPISAEFIGRAIDQAAQERDQAVLIELRTPGGLADSTREIIQKILASPVPVIVYVAPSGGYAASAGFFILESADVAAMAPGTNAGAAHPVLIGPGGDEKMDPVMKEKLENDSAAFMRSFVSKRGRNVDVAESAVRQSKSFTDQEALQQHLIDVVATSDQDLLKQLDGREVTRFNGSKLTLHLAGAQIRTFDMSLKQRILNYLIDPNVAFILFTIGMLALYGEFNHPGAVIPGVVGFIFILLALFSFHLLPTRYAALILIISGFVLFALEAKFQTHGVLTIGGIVVMVIGALMLVDGPIPEMRVRLTTALAVAVPMGLITVFLVGLVLKARRAKVVTGKEGLVGGIGVAQTVLTPEGKVFINGEIWNAVAAAQVNPGDRVRVRAVKGLVLEVEPAPAASGSTQP
jgi:membrane-bound serine protease (ClpP class)